MTTTKNVIDFAEKVYLEDRAEMQKTFDFEEFINPSFKEKFGSEYRTEYLQYYDKQRTDFINQKKIEFNYKNQTS